MSIMLLVNGLLYVLVYMKFGITINSIMYCLLISLLLIVSIVDFKYMIIPDSLIIIGLFLGVICTLINKEFYDSIFGALIGFGLFFMIEILTNSMGGGDIKLVAVLGFIFGIKGVLFISLFSFVIGAFISVVLIILKIKSIKDEIPFGPFISLATLLYLFLGDEIIYKYMVLLKNIK